MTKPISGKRMREAREEGVSVPLSTGIWVAIRPVPLDKLLATGEIPDSLSGIAAASIVQPGSEIPTDRNDIESVTKYFALANLITRLALVSPKIVDDPQGDDECSLEDFSAVERGEILTFSRQAAENLRRFRDQQTASMAALSKMSEVQPVTEQPTAD